MSKPLYKLWVEIERLDKDGDEDYTYCPPLPDCIGVATSEEDIVRQAWAIIKNFGTHPQMSDCRPDASGKFKWLRRCHTVECNCVLCHRKHKQQRIRKTKGKVNQLYDPADRGDVVQRQDPPEKVPTKKVKLPRSFNRDGDDRCPVCHFTNCICNRVEWEAK